MVAAGGIEPPTRGFSVAGAVRSHLPQALDRAAFFWLVEPRLLPQSVLEREFVRAERYAIGDPPMVSRVEAKGTLHGAKVEAPAAVASHLK